MQAEVGLSKNVVVLISKSVKPLYQAYQWSKLFSQIYSWLCPNDRNIHLSEK
jgi:hypothetical protein